ncbi:MAG TPA: PstS family phosphate ABC transporter substrate-binding protein [Promineifilum sp.]|nr:PstS family phosphate ABC transporter substrate-binding protein [Promineifilum sp.]
MRSKLLALLILVTLMAAACGGTAQQAEPETTAPTATTVDETAATAEPADAAEPTAASATSAEGEGTMPLADPLAVSGDIVTAGSSTVYPLAEAIAERYQAEGFSGQITIDSIGTGGGFERFCGTGETDIANASRAIKDEEAANCAAIGRTPVEFRIGTDGLAVVVSQENDFVQDLTLEQLALVFSTAETWADVDPSFPDEPIERYIPGTDSGTFDYFTEVIYPDLEDGVANPQLEAANLQQSEDDNVLVQGVAGSPYAIGYFGYAYAANNADTVRLVAVEGVVPDFDTVEGGTYALARPLFLYSDAAILQAKPQVADYINFFLTNVDEEIETVGYFPASDEALNEARNHWLVAMGLAATMPENTTGETVAQGAMCELPAADPLAVSGDIVTAGSSTVYPLAEAIAERYQAEGFSGQITIDSIGTGGGFERFCGTGETDIANASRAIKDEEAANCAAIGRTPVEFRIGTDGLAVVVSQENDFVQDLTLEQLALVFSTAETWADVDPSFPDEPIERYIPGTDSGTFDYFTEVIYPDLEDGVANPQLEAANLQQSEDDNVLVQGVAGSPYAIGYFGYAYAANNADTVRLVAVEGVVPDFDTVEGGTYALARPLFLYSDAAILQAKPQVADYINFFLTNVDEEIETVGYFPASDEALNGASCAFVDATGQ